MMTPRILAITDDVIRAAIAWSRPSAEATVLCWYVIRATNRASRATGASGYPGKQGFMTRSASSRLEFSKRGN